MAEEREYIAARIGQALAAHPDIGELDVRVAIRGDRVFLTGNVSTADRKALITEVVSELVPEHQVCNELAVPSYESPPGEEELA